MTSYIYHTKDLDSLTHIHHKEVLKTYDNRYMRHKLAEKIWFQLRSQQHPAAKRKLLLHEWLYSSNASENFSDSFIKRNGIIGHIELLVTG